jgi:hypothetical protein
LFRSPSIFFWNTELLSISKVFRDAGRRFAAVLAAALLFAAWAESQHLADVAAHDGAVCEVCLFASGSGHGVAPGPVHVPLALGLCILLAVEYAAFVPSFLLRRVQRPRAPPVFS